jgi:alpha-2-macroglobulin
MRRLKAMAALQVSTRLDANLQAAAIYLLTRSGEVTTNYALNLTDTLQRAHGNKWHRDLSAAWLAGTWMALKLEKEGRALIEQHRAALAKPVEKKEREALFYECQLSNAAQSFAVVCRHFPEIAGQFTFEDLKPITDSVHRGEFHTHSAAWTILALKSYTSLAKASSMELSVAEQSAGSWRPLLDGKFGTDATRIQFRRKAAPGAPELGAWYQTVEFGFPKVSPVKPEIRGLEIFRELLDEKQRVVAEGKVGVPLRARVRIRNANAQRLSNIAIVDLLPAGFENAPGGLRPGLGTLPGATYIDVREDRNLFFLDLGPGESRTFEWEIRPTCAGKFNVPAAFGEAMYDRAISGTGVASHIVVVPQ